MSGHLREPWFIVPRNVEHDGSVYPSHIANVDGHIVCYIESETVARMAAEAPESFWGNPTPSRVATCQLISAAPDLLEALSMAITRLREIEICSDISIPNELREAARAAIAKATGESP